MEQRGPAAGRPPASGNDRTGAMRLLTVLSFAIALGTLALGAIVLLEARNDAWRQAEHESGNLTRALAREIARTIAVYDLSLQGANEALQLEGFDRLNAETRQLALFDRAASAEYLGSLLVLDTDGWIAADSTSLTPHRLNFADRDYFRVHQARADAGLFLSAPFRSRLRNGDASIAISRRLAGPGNAFAGVVSGTLRLAYFQDLFASLDLGPGSSVFLLNMDRQLVARHPPTAGDAGRDMRASDNVAGFMAAPSGSFVAVSAIDGIDRLYTFRRIDNLPLVLGVAESVQQIYAAWWRKALAIGAILLILSGATVILGVLFRREMTRRVTAEDGLRGVAEQLRVMATTDSLTGLPNRRAFETALDTEWRRARRAGSSVALLMLDADWFKPYNDTYGHLAGDRVLQQLATSLCSAVLRPGDLCARFGGEEFAILLPETGTDAALAIAHRIRADVAALLVPHSGSPLGHLTVSVGAAAVHPRPDALADELVTLADLALYEAKRGGRDQVRAAASSTELVRADEALRGPGARV